MLFRLELQRFQRNCFDAVIQCVKYAGLENYLLGGKRRRGVRLKELILCGFPLLMTGSVVAQECYESSILSPTPFMGNNGEIIKLSDGSLWEVKYEQEYLYEYYPNVVICPSQGKLAIKDKVLNIEKVGEEPPAKPKSETQKPSAPQVIESQIQDDFEGWEGETIVKLTNGQIWQQSEYYYHYHYAFMPKVIIYRSGGGNKMKVDGIEKSVGVELLK
jgi:hypothetical protein